MISDPGQPELHSERPRLNCPHLPPEKKKKHLRKQRVMTSKSALQIRGLLGTKYFHKNSKALIIPPALILMRLHVQFKGYRTYGLAEIDENLTIPDTKLFLLCYSHKKSPTCDLKTYNLCVFLKGIHKVKCNYLLNSESASSSSTIVFFLCFLGILEW